MIILTHYIFFFVLWNYYWVNHCSSTCDKCWPAMEIHSFKKYFLRSCYAPDTVLEAWGASVNKRQNCSRVWNNENNKQNIMSYVLWKIMERCWRIRAVREGRDGGAFYIGQPGLALLGVEFWIDLMKVREYTMQVCGGKNVLCRGYS